MPDPEVNVEIVNPTPENPTAEVVVIENAVTEVPVDLAIRVGELSADIEVLKKTVEELKFKTDSATNMAETAIDIAVTTPAVVEQEIIEPVVEEIVTEVIPAPVEAEETEVPVERAKKKRHFI